jgi:hypothetical protein
MRRMTWAMPVLAALVGGILGGAVAQYGLAASSVMATIDQSVITAQEFRLAMGDGTVQARLALWDGKRPVLQLADARCPARVSLGISEQNNQPFFILFDEDCRRRFTIDLVPDGLPEVVFRDDMNVPRARLHLLKDGNPMLRFFDVSGRTLWTAAEESPSS